MAFEGLSDRLQNAFKKLTGKGKLNEQNIKEAMREVRMALLEADVNYVVVKDFIKIVSARAVGIEVLESLTPGQQVIKIVNEELTRLMGGENAKLRLCKLMLKDVNWLVLDEPTNHLDVDAKDELKRALKEFKGSVLLVSHEPEFYEDWVDKVWNIEDWTTKII